MDRHRRHKTHHEDESWLITYADFITLLLCFFFILLAMSEPKQAEMEKMKDALGQFVKDKTTKQPFNQLYDKLNAMIEQLQVEDRVSVEKTNRGLIVELSASSFYDPGSADFRKEALPVLDQMAQLLESFDYQDYIVQVDGHTDDVPIETAQFPSNWELSAVRATHIVRYFIDGGMPPAKFRAAGFADTEPKVPNLDDLGNPVPENRELNRRIAIKIERREE